MRYIDRTNCKMYDRGMDKEVKAMCDLTRTATKIAEQRKLGVLKRSDGQYRVIKESGLGAGYEEVFQTLREVDKFLKNISKKC